MIQVIRILIGVPLFAASAAAQNRLIAENGQSLEFARGWCVATMTYALAEYGSMHDVLDDRMPRVLVEGIKIELADGKVFHCNLKAALDRK